VVGVDVINVSSNGEKDIAKNAINLFWNKLFTMTYCCDLGWSRTNNHGPLSSNANNQIYEHLNLANHASRYLGLTNSKPRSNVLGVGLVITN
jgi:hypothetical protein